MTAADGERLLQRALPLPAAAPRPAAPPETPTSVLLPPVRERAPPRRRRRAPRAAPPTPAGFPVPALVEVDAGGAEGVTAPPERAAVPPPRAAALDAEASDRIFEGMSREEKLEMAAEMEQQLDPALVYVLRKRFAAKRALESDAPAALAGSGPANVATAGDASTPVIARKTPSRVRFAEDVDADDAASTPAAPFPSADVVPLDESRGDLEDPVYSLGRAGTAAGSAAPRPDPALVGMVEDVLSLRHAARAQQPEGEKLAWTARADEAPPGSVEGLDSAVSKSVEALGAVADWRFDLSGRRLSPEQVASLPAHLGLHHHGAQPEAAGYTLGELLLLARSSVVAQRASAFKVLGQVFAIHGEVVVGPLLHAGGVAALLADTGRDGASGRHVIVGGSSNISLSRSYLDLVAALVGVARRVATPDKRAPWVTAEQLYFEAPLYAPPRALEEGEGTGLEDETASSSRPADLVTVIGRSSCVFQLVLIASAALSAGDMEAVSSALDSCQCIVSGSQEAALSIAQDAMSVADLYQMAMSDPADGSTLSVGHCNFVKSACSVLSACMLAAGWSGNAGTLLSGTKGIADAKLLGPLLSKHVSASAFSRDDAVETRLELAQFALRVLRSALTFGQALEVASSVVREGLLFIVGRSMPRAGFGAKRGECTVIGYDSRPSRASSSACIEAYLALESYAHALFADVVKVEDRKHKSCHNGGENSEDAELSSGELCSRVDFAKAQLKALVPVALEAATRFAGVVDDPHISLHGERCVLDICARAAGGHFVATVLAMTAASQVLLSGQVVDRVYKVARKSLSAVTDAVSASLASGCVDAGAVSVGCSVAHAAARLLPHAGSGLPVVSEIVDVLSRISSNVHSPAASDAKDVPFSESCRNVVRNAYAEWLGLLSRQSPTPQSVQSALNLLTLCSDRQVASDLVSRCVLSVRVVQVLSPDLSVGVATEIVARLLPQTVSSLLNVHAEPVAGAVSDEQGQAIDEQGPIDLPLSEMQELPLFWMSSSCGAPLQGSIFLRALRRTGVVSPQVSLRAILLGVPSDVLVSSADSTRALALSVSEELMEAATHAGREILPGGLDNAMPSVSSTPIPALTAKLLDLGEHLVDCGPSGEDASVSLKAVSSILLTAMLRSGEAHTSLRQELWTSTVLDCGGMALYNAARVLGSSDFARCDDALADRYMDLLVAGRCTRELPGAVAVWRAVVPTLLSGNECARRLLGTDRGRKTIREWAEFEKSRSDGLDESLLSTLLETCMDE